jgi:hypothetical protein
LPYIYVFDTVIDSYNSHPIRIIVDNEVTGLLLKNILLKIKIKNDPRFFKDPSNILIKFKECGKNIYVYKKIP